MSQIGPNCCHAKQRGRKLLPSWRYLNLSSTNYQGDGLCWILWSDACRWSDEVGKKGMKTASRGQQLGWQRSLRTIHASESHVTFGPCQQSTYPPHRFAGSCPVPTTPGGGGRSTMLIAGPSGGVVERLSHLLEHLPAEPTRASRLRCQLRRQC